MSEPIFPGINILIKEYQCPCCGALPPDLRASPFYLISFQKWQVIRGDWGKPIPISKGGGFRCSRYQANLLLAGKTDTCCSPHFFWALDNDFDTKEECEEFALRVEARFPELRIGTKSYLAAGKTFVHIDNAYLVTPQPSPTWVENYKW